MTGAVAVPLPARPVFGLWFPFRRVAVVCRRIFRLPAASPTGRGGWAGARSASPLRLEGEARGEGERGAQLGGFVHGPAVDSIVPVEFSVVYHDAEAEMKARRFRRRNDTPASGRQ